MNDGDWALYGVGIALVIAALTVVLQGLVLLYPKKGETIGKYAVLIGIGSGILGTGLILSVLLWSNSLFRLGVIILSMLIGFLAMIILKNTLKTGSRTGDDANPVPARTTTVNSLFNITIKCPKP
jgi:hypothetical protein